MTLVDCFSPSFELVRNALHGSGADVKTLREEVGRQVERDVISASAAYTPGTMLRARRLVSMWIDSRLGGEEWPGRDLWRDNPLLGEKSGSGGEYLAELVGRLDSDNDEDAQLAILALPRIRLASR